MKRLSILLVLLAPLVAPSSARAVPSQGPHPVGEPSVIGGKNPVGKPGQLGVGLAGGWYTGGVTVKTAFTEAFAGAATLGSWWGYGLSLSADALWEQPPLAQNDTASLDWYAGIGPLLALGDGLAAVGADAIAGLEARFKPIPLELTLDIRPTVLFGSTHFGYFRLAGQGAIRYWF